MSKNSALIPSKKILIFAPSLRLVAIVRSVRSAAELMAGNNGNCSAVNISNAAIGKQYTAKGWHIRHLMDDKVEITVDDIGVLKLHEYDHLAGIDREYPSSMFVRRKKVLNFKKSGYKYV